LEQRGTTAGKSAQPIALTFRILCLARYDFNGEFLPLPKAGLRDQQLGPEERIVVCLAKVDAGNWLVDPKLGLDCILQIATAERTRVGEGCQALRLALKSQSANRKSQIAWPTHLELSASTIRFSVKHFFNRPKSRKCWNSEAQSKKRRRGPSLVIDIHSRQSAAQLVLGSSVALD
jgi:hypothetical protein